VSEDALEPGGADSGAEAPASEPSGRHLSIEERRRLVAESLRVGNPGNHARDLPTQADPRHECQIELAVEDIRPYEHNPRRAGNARFAEIKASIRASGVRNPLTVTRRPGDEHFIVEAGGNTRLLAIQQLWSETADARFQRLVVLFRPWRSESHVLTAHLIENELRGEMTFWDKASGVAALKARLEAEKGHGLSLRQLEDELKGLGLSVNTATLAHCLFATERLRTLGEAVADLSGLDVKTMQPRLNALRRYAPTRATLAEADLYATVFEPVFQDAADRHRQSRAFSAQEVCRACEEALARQLSEPVEQLRMALDSPARSTQASPDTSPAHGPVAMAPTTNGDPPWSEPAVSTANAATAVSDPPVQTGDALPPSDENAAVRSRFVEHVRRLAALVGIDTFVRFHDAAPLGYSMDALPIPSDGDSAPPRRLQAWWLLAALSGQLDPSAWVSVLEGSAEGGTGPHDAADPHPPTPVAFDAAFFGWLVDAHDETASAFWSVLAHVREWPASAPGRAMRWTDPGGTGGA